MQCTAPMVSFMSVHTSGAVIEYLINIHKPSELTTSKLVAPALTVCDCIHSEFTIFACVPVMLFSFSMKRYSYVVLQKEPENVSVMVTWSV